MSDNTSVSLSTMINAISLASADAVYNGSTKLSAALIAARHVLPLLVTAAQKSNDKLESILTTELACDLRDCEEWLALDSLLEQLKD